MAPPAAKRAEIFALLAAGLEIPEVLKRLGLSREELQTLFQETADRYRGLEEGFWRLHCDGASQGNPGPAGAGAVLWDPEGKIRAEKTRYLGEATNNVAEYQALILGLDTARQLGVRKLRIFADSELLVKQIQGAYQVKAPHLLPLWRQARQALEHFASFTISHVPRHDNRLADRLAQQAIDHRPPKS